MISRKLMHYKSPKYWLLSMLIASICLVSIVSAIKGLYANDNGTNYWIEKLQYLLYNTTDEISNSEVEDIRIAAFQAGEAALPLLTQAMRDFKEDIFRRGVVAQGIAYIGGPKAVKILKEQYSTSKDKFVKMVLCSALATTGTEEDRLFLIDALDKASDEEEGWPRLSAVFSLGILREEGAIEELTDVANKVKGTLAAEAAAEVLSWMKKGDWQIPQYGEADESDKIILSIFKNGIPRINESIQFYEMKRNRLWIQEQQSWEFVPASKPPDKVPLIEFDISTSSNGSRALVSVSLSFGHTNAVGYDYILFKDNGSWIVRAIFPTWIS